MSGRPRSSPCGDRRRAATATRSSRRSSLGAHSPRRPDPPTRGAILRRRTASSPRSRRARAAGRRRGPWSPGDGACCRPAGSSPSTARRRWARRPRPAQPARRGAQARRAGGALRDARRPAGGRRVRPRLGVRDRGRRARRPLPLRQAADVIEIYLEQARAVGARLMLDIQPGRSTLPDEPRRCATGSPSPTSTSRSTPSGTSAPRDPRPDHGQGRRAQVNAVIRSLAAIVRANDLPPKLLVVHQFRRGMIRGRAQDQAAARACRWCSTSTGSARRRAKAAGYAALSSAGALQRLLALLPARHAADEARRRARARARARLPALPVAAVDGAAGARAQPAKPTAIAQVGGAREAIPARPPGREKARARPDDVGGELGAAQPGERPPVLAAGRGARRPGARRRR